MIQIIPERESFQSKLGTSVGKGISEGLESALNSLGQLKKQNRLKSALKSLETTFSPDYELTPQEQMLNVYHALAEFPEVASSFGAKVNPYGIQQQKSFSDQLMKQHEDTQLQNSIGKAQEIYNNPEYSPEQKIFGIHQVLGKHPTLLKTLFGTLDDTQTNQDDEQFTQGYSALLEGNDDDFKEVIDNPKVSKAVKKDLMIRKEAVTRDNRQFVNNVTSTYKDTLKDIQLQIDKTYGKDKTFLQKKKERIARDMKIDLKALSNNPSQRKGLRIYEEISPEFQFDKQMAEEGPGVYPAESGVSPMDEVMEEPSMPQQKKAGKRVRFDPKNPVHAERANELLQLAGNDPDKFNALMAQEFE